MTNNCNKNGVSELLEEYPELSDNGFTKKTTYNITPDGFNGISLFKSSQTAATIALYPGYSYTYVDISSSPGVISAVLCDADGNGVTDDILFTYANEELQMYGIGYHSGSMGESYSVFRAEGDLKLYLTKQEAAEGMPEVFSVLAVSVLACNGVALSPASVITGAVVSMLSTV